MPGGSNPAEGQCNLKSSYQEKEAGQKLDSSTHRNGSKYRYQIG